MYDQKGFMYSFKTYPGVAAVENGTQEGTHCIYDTFFPFCFASFTRMSLPDLESPMFISDHLVQQPQLQAADLYRAGVGVG